jgi:hypothetical protein
MQGYAEAEAAVAPKIALELLHAWVAGDPPYGEPVNAALKFIWHDRETLDRVRESVASDLARGRRLIPRFRSQAAVHGALFATRIAEIEERAARLREHAIRSAVVASRELSDLTADARRRTLPMDGPLTLDAEPYLVWGKTGLEVRVDAGVRHEVTRGAAVEFEWDHDLIPWDRAAEILGAERYAAALAAADMDEDEVLFALRVRVAVTGVKAAPGFESRLYPKPWPEQFHVLLVPGPRGEEPQPETTHEAGPFTVRPLRADAPAQFPRD